MISKINNPISHFNNALNTAVFYFLFVAGMAFFAYSLKAGKGYYFLIAIFIYLISLVIRKKLLKVNKNENLTEIGYFIYSLTFLNYFLYFSGIDKNFTSTLPESILLTSGSAFTFYILLGLVVSLNNGIFTKYSFLFFVIGIGIIYLLRNYISHFFLANPSIATLILGAPIIYLFTTLTGLNSLTPQNKK